MGYFPLVKTEVLNVKITKIVLKYAQISCGSTFRIHIRLSSSFLICSTWRLALRCLSIRGVLLCALFWYLWNLTACIISVLCIRKTNLIKGQCQEIFDFMFFHVSCFHQFPPKPQSIPLGQFRKFSEIFAAQGAQPVSLTLLANGKIFNHKSFKYLFGQLWIEELIYK